MVNAQSVPEERSAMSIQIRISYQQPQELKEVLRLLAPAVKSCKVARKQEGQYKRAYVVLK